MKAPSKEDLKKAISMKSSKGYNSPIQRSKRILSKKKDEKIDLVHFKHIFY